MFDRQLTGHAIDHLLNGCIDILIIDNFIVYSNTKIKKSNTSLLSEKYYLFIENIIHILDILKNKDKNFKKVLLISNKFFKKNNISFINNYKKIKIHGKKFDLNYENRSDLVNKFLPIYKNISNGS